MIFLAAGALCSAKAQVEVEVKLDQDQFLPGEPVIAAVRVTNRSGELLRLGETQDWLAISVEGRTGLVVEKLDDVPVVGAFDLDSSKIATKQVDLAPHFNLTQPGRYTIAATVRVKEWDKEFASKPKSFDVLKGAKLWEQEFGVPRPGQAEPEVRKFALQQARYLKQLKLYVRVTDAPETKVFRVFSLGPMVSFGQPESQVDRTGNLHVLFQTSARGFSYCVVNPSGELVVRQIHDYSNTRPKLALSERGEMTVNGGTRRLTSSDIPIPPLFSDFTNDVAPPKP